MNFAAASVVVEKMARPDKSIFFGSCKLLLQELVETDGVAVIASLRPWQGK